MINRAPLSPSLQTHNHHHHRHSFRIAFRRSHAASSNHQHYATPADFPQQGYNDPEDEWGGYDGTSGNSSGGSNTDQGFDRRAYKQIGSGAKQNNDRMEMMSRLSTGEDDEWESYASMDDGNGVDGMDGVNGVGNEAPSGAVNGNAESNPVPRNQSGRKSNAVDEQRTQTQMERQMPKDDGSNASPAVNESTQPNSQRINGSSRSPPSGPVADDSTNQFFPSTATNASPVAGSSDGDDARPPKTLAANTNEKGGRRQRIPTEEIDQIKSTISLVDVVESYNLDGFVRTHSGSAKACCPFHDDNNPSMSVSDDKGLYKCFACGAGGDVFNFIREYDYLEDKRNKGEDKMGYMQAVEFAAREFGDGDFVEDWNFFGGGGKGEFEGMSEETKEKIREREGKKERYEDWYALIYSFSCPMNDVLLIVCNDLTYIITGKYIMAP